MRMSAGSRAGVHSVVGREEVSHVDEPQFSMAQRERRFETLLMLQTDILLTRQLTDPTIQFQ